jgi:hypothetical protein
LKKRYFDAQTNEISHAEFSDFSHIVFIFQSVTHGRKGYMIIFFSRIPAETEHADIIEFIGPAIKGGIFKKTGLIKDINIMILKDILLDKLEYHALITIEPDEVAERISLKLNRKPINGKHIAVRGFVSRGWRTDLRINTQQINTNFKNRRIGDRRRGYRMKVIEDIIASPFKGRRGFNRVY